MTAAPDRYEIATAAGAHRMVAIGEGSSAMLNGGTRLVLDRNDPRFAELVAGEAMFTLRHDAARPFVVVAGAHRLLDAGTVFNLARDGPELSLEVIEGAVLYEPGGVGARLAAGRTLRVGADGHASIGRKAPDAMAGWRRGRLSYEGAPLADVARDLSRNLGVEVTVDAPLATRPFTGSIRIDRDAAASVRSLAATLGLRARRAGAGWRIEFAFACIPLRPAAAFIFVLAAATPAHAQVAAFDIPGGRLDRALIALAEQAGLSIGASDPGLARIRVGPLRGRMSARAALARLLAGTGYSFTFVDARTVRVARAAPAPAPRAPPPAPTPTPPPPEPAQPDIIVTASKQGTALGLYGGTVRLVELGRSEVGRFGDRGSEALLQRLPMLASTSLGPGRDKLFIRGVADSSFNGPSQSVVGQYLGDVRLTYNAPDPDLRLYDVERVELLEGPQGTLYGSGALGGILRLVPREPDAARFAGALSGGLMLTRHGDPGGDIAAMLNLPLAPGRLALRAVGYGSIDGGYIDDPGRGLRDVNRTTIYGGRIALRWQPDNAWDVELGGLAQYLSGRDGQYAQRGLAPLRRRAAFAQPFDNDYQLAQLTVRRRWPGVELVSATGIVRHTLESRFDATGFPGTAGPQLYAEDIGITLISNETRLSRTDSGGGGWVIGWSVLRDTSRIARRLGPPPAPAPLAGVRNEVTEAALFGQYGHALTPSLTATVGARLTYARGSGRLLDAPDDENAPDRTDLRVSPSAALAWRRGRLLVYGRFQQGFRAGGLAVAASGSATSAQRFESDSLTAYEIGLRYGRADVDRFSVNAAFSYSRWADIQADLIDARGLPYTANLGDGRIYGAEIEAGWRVAPFLSLEAARVPQRKRAHRPGRRLRRRGRPRPSQRSRHRRAAGRAFPRGAFARPRPHGRRRLALCRRIAARHRRAARHLPGRLCRRPDRRPARFRPLRRRARPRQCRRRARQPLRLRQSVRSRRGRSGHAAAAAHDPHRIRRRILKRVRVWRRRGVLAPCSP